MNWNFFFRRFKLYRLGTLLSILSDSWGNSKHLKKANHLPKSALFYYFDLVYSALVYGADFTNYKEFRFYQLSHYGRDQFITWKRNDRLTKIFTDNQTVELFLDKSKFNATFSEFIHRDWLDTKGSQFSSIKAFIDLHRQVIVKPLFEHSGHGIKKINYDDNQGIESLLESISEGDRFILEELITNVSEISNLNPQTLNTIRIVSVLDKNNDLHFISAGLRIGVGNCLIDNVLSGGLVANIDLNLGIIDKPAINEHGELFNIHPYSNQLIIGFVVPFWEECKNLIKKAAYICPKARYVGWDIAITPNGLELLEGNIPPGESITQCDLLGKYFDVIKYR